MNEALGSDYLFVGAAIRARLAAQVPALAADGAVQDIEHLEQAVQRAVSDATVFVAWDGDNIEAGEQGRAAGGRSQAMRQVWTAIVVVRNSAQHDGNARNVEAGPLLAQVHTALAGWMPPGAFRPLQRVQGRRAQYTANVGLYPLAFEVGLTL